MSKFHGSQVELIVRNHSSVKEMAPARARRRAQVATESRVEELAAIAAIVTKMRDDLLDYNPVLAVMADALHRAVELEAKSQRCNVMLTSGRS
jgi:hypothetical protein